MTGAATVRLSHDIFEQRYSPKAIALRWFERPKATIYADRMAWYVLFVTPAARSADRVEEFLTRLGIEAYWPKLRQERKRPIRATLRKGIKTRYEKIEVVLPVLPRYVLVRLPADRPPFGLLTSREALFFGICGLVSTGNGPACDPGLPTTIADAKVDEIRAREAAGEWTFALAAGPKIGSVVRITDGPFLSFNATVEELLGIDRIRATVSIFGRASPIELDVDQVEQLAR